MPLCWKRGANPYRHNLFLRIGGGPSRLLLGDKRLRTQLEMQMRSRLRSAKGSLQVDGGEVIDEADLGEAKQALNAPRSLAEELLIAHPPPRQQSRLREVTEQLEQAAVWPAAPTRIGLRHPCALFWLVPPPGPEDVPLLPWREFGFVAPGDAADEALDIVFDQ